MKTAAARLKEKPALLFLLIALWFGLEYFVLGPFSFARIVDESDISLPRHIRLAAELWTNGVSYWSPAMGAGLDRLANDLAYFHPTVILFALLPGWLAYQLLVFLDLFLTGYFVFRLAKERLSLSETAAVLAGACAPFYSVFLTYNQLGFSLLPFLLWSLERLLDDERASALKAAALAALYAACSSIVISVPFSLAAVFAWFVLVRRRTPPAFFFCFVLLGLAAAVFNLQTLRAMSLNQPWSHRADWSFVSGTSLWATVRPYFTNTLSLYKMPLALAVAGAAASRLKSREFRIMLALFLLSTGGMGFADYASGKLAGSFPVLAGFRLNRFTELAYLLAAVCAGLGLDALPARFRKAAAVAAFGLIALSSLRVKADNVRDWFYQGSYAANFHSAPLRELARIGGTKPFRVATVHYGFFPGYVSAYGLETTDGYMNLYPRSYRTFWSKVLEPLTARDPALKEYMGRFGSRPYLYADPLVESPAGLEVSRYYRMNLLSLANTRYIISRNPLIGPDLVAIRRQEPSWDALPKNVRARLRLKENFSGKSYFHIYENKAALPRFFVAGAVRVFPSQDALWDALAAADAATLRSTAFIEEVIPGPTGEGGLNSSIVVKSYAPDHIELSVETTSVGILIASNNYSPFWKCSVAGADKPIFRADGAFWGVRLDAGRHAVVFDYRPPYRAN